MKLKEISSEEAEKKGKPLDQYNIFGGSGSDNLYAVDLEERIFFLIPIKSRKLPRSLFDDRDPEELPEPNYEKLLYSNSILFIAGD